MSSSPLFDSNLIKSIFEYTLDKYSLLDAGSEGNLDAILYFEVKDLSFPFLDEAFIVAAKNGHAEVIQYIDENYEVYTKEVAFEVAAKKGQFSVVEYLAGQVDEDYALDVAIKYPEIIGIVLDTGVKISRTAFESAVVKKEFGTIEIFVKKGWKLKQGDLLWVAGRGWTDMFNLFVELGTEPTEETLRSICLYDRRSIVFDYLTKRGKPLDILDEFED